MECQRFRIDEPVSQVKKASEIVDARVAEDTLSRLKDRAYTPSGVIIEYLLKEAPEFRRLSELREKVKARTSTFVCYHGLTSDRDGTIQKAIDSLKNSARLPITRIIRWLSSSTK
jgi:hypothetical protein